MDKDPAFLFYSKDFYEGTRLMLPEERACYVDLMIYQHQNGFIPLDIRRILQYCSGIDKATLEATLEAKFKKTTEGWYNEKLKKIIDDRKEYSTKQSENGRIGQFFKTAKSDLSPERFKQLKDFVYKDFGKESLLKLINKEKTLKGSLKALLKHLANAIANEDVIVNKDIDKDTLEKSEKPLPEQPKRFSFRNSLLKLGADKKLLSDWMKVRKDKKASNTKTALEGFLTQVEKSGKDLNEVLQICAERSWKGFNADWISKPDKEKSFMEKLSEI